MDDDYISLKAFKKKYLCCGYIPEMAESELDSFSGANVRPVVYGEWKITSGQIENAVCSCCGTHFQAYYSDYQYCPRCGADMRGGKA